MAGLGSASTLEWRQGPVRAHFQNGTARNSPASDHRGHVHRKLGQQKGGGRDSWLMRLLESQPKMVVDVVLANKMARRLWAMCVKKEVYETPILAA
jgi:hypothetical protein